jgi:hypothetical protein
MFEPVPVSYVPPVARRVQASSGNAEEECIPLLHARQRQRSPVDVWAGRSRGADI